MSNSSSAESAPAKPFLNQHHLFPTWRQNLIVLGILPTPLPAFTGTAGDEKLWVPQAPNISFRPLIFSVSQGYFVNLLRVRRSGILSRHRHTGPVHAWWAEEGGYSYEPSGDIHTLEVPAGVDEMTTLFHVTGAYVYVDVDGNPVGVEAVSSKLQSVREHYENVGLEAAFAEQFIR
ncbi:RmlC-like cupin domain-containing protein [Xylariaceae sp. FL1272]|nr:RmlC-like cupin domain-containing protein [Xylariaceae sp. FL1272]